MFQVLIDIKIDKNNIRIIINRCGNVAYSPVHFKYHKKEFIFGAACVEIESRQNGCMEICKNMKCPNRRECDYLFTISHKIIVDSDKVDKLTDQLVYCPLIEEQGIVHFLKLL